MVADNPALKSLVRCLGAATVNAVSSSRVLVVGAGGIGCELLKNLVLCGFLHIDVIDLDTIDISNLNRQFLFSRRDVGLSKSICAKRAIQEFINQSLSQVPEINAYEANIKEDRFGPSYIKTFDLVLNALDNVSARQHVNRICIAADVPLIDSGTMGYLGQVMVIQKNVSRCYDCDVKTEAKNKSYAICTIRNTPEKPVHCVVWAKEVVKLVLGNSNDSMLAELNEDNSNDNRNDDNENEESDSERADHEQQEKEIEARSMIMKAAHLPKDISQHNISTTKTRTILKNFCVELFEALFFSEVDLKLQLKDGYKGAKFKPTPIHFDDLGGDVVSTSNVSDQMVWDAKTNRDIYVNALIKIITSRFDQVGSIDFDKDDDDVMDLVVALTNLRAMVFKIPTLSRFELKGIAGNIVHAIATTNAVIAGVQTLEAIRIIKNKQQKQPLLEGSKAVWLSKEPTSAGALLQPQKELEKPNPNCYTCGNAQLSVSLDVTNFTLGDLVNKILKQKLGINSPSISLASSEIYMEGNDLDEEEIELFESNLSKRLQDCPAGGIKHNSLLSVEDFSQELSFSLLIQHIPRSEFDEEENPDMYVISGDQDLFQPKTTNEPEHNHSNDESDDVKRRTNEHEREFEEPVPKRHKVSDATIEVDDDIVDLS